MKLCFVTSLIFFAGFPATIILGRTSFVTIAPAAIIASLPISTPGQIVAPPPIAHPNRNFAPLIVGGLSRKWPIGELFVKDTPGPIILNQQI